MSYHDGQGSDGCGTPGKRRIQEARLAVGRLAAGAADPAASRRIAAELNDAYLRLQFALVIDDGAMISAQRRAWEALLAAARREASTGPEPRAA